MKSLELQISLEDLSKLWKLVEYVTHATSVEDNLKKASYQQHERK